MSVTLSLPRYDELRDKEQQLALVETDCTVRLDGTVVDWGVAEEAIAAELNKTLPKLAEKQAELFRVKESLAKYTARLETVRIELGPLQTDHSLFIKCRDARKPIVPLTFWQRLKFLFKGAHS